MEFGHRLHVFARDSATSLLRFTSSADLLTWSPWHDVPAAGLRPDSPVAAAALGDRLFLFGIYDTGKPPESEVVVVTSTADTVTWTPWTLVEAGARPEGRPAADQPLDVAATQFGDRLYIASRWMGPAAEPDPGPYFAVNFSGDGSNWSGWRVPTSSEPFKQSTAPAVAASGNHVYLLAPALVSGVGTPAPVWAY